MYISDQGGGGGSGGRIICKTSVREANHSVAQIHHLRFVDHMTTMLITEGGITSHNSSSQRTPSPGVAPCLQQPVTLGQRARKGWGDTGIVGVATC